MINKKNKLVFILLTLVLTFSLTSISLAASPDQYEYNNNYQNATNKYFGSRAYATIHDQNDIDYYIYTSVIPNTTAYINFVPPDCSIDYDFYVLDSNFNTVVQATGVTPGQEETYTFTTASSREQYTVLIYTKNYGWSSQEYSFNIYY